MESFLVSSTLVRVILLQISNCNPRLQLNILKEICCCNVIFLIAIGTEAVDNQSYYSYYFCGMSNKH